MTKIADIPMTTEGMELDQVIAMLHAARAQGATHFKVGCKTAGSNGICSDIDWMSMEPVDGCVYLAAILPQSEWEPMSNQALESLDW